MGQKLALRGKRVSKLSFSPGLTPWLQWIALHSKQLNKKNTLQYFKINNILIFYRLVVGESKYYQFIFGVTLIIVSFWKGPRPCTKKCCNSPVFTAVVNMNIQQIQLQPYKGRDFYSNNVDKHFYYYFNINLTELLTNYK